MATLTGDLPEQEQPQFNKPVLLFGNIVKELALKHQIPASSVSVAKASLLFAARDNHHAFFIFVESMGATEIRYMDLERHGNISLTSLNNEIKMKIGNPVFGFSIPLSDMNNEALIEKHARKSATEYIEKLAEQFQNKGESEMDSNLCFVIMSFSNNPQLQDFYEMAIKPTIEGLGFDCIRVDEQEFNGSIKDRILENIRKAKFIVADITEARPNCYYELGIAHALGKDVIHLANNTDDIHFDINDFNFIIYSRVEELKTRLKNRIESTIGSN